MGYLYLILMKLEAFCFQAGLLLQSSRRQLLYDGNHVWAGKASCDAGLKFESSEEVFNDRKAVFTADEMTQLHDALLVTCVRVTELICSSVQFLCCEHGISCT